LQFDFEPFYFRLNLLSGRRADIAIEVDLGEIALKNILHEEHLIHFASDLHHTLIF
jgi:hypothetical protein